METVKNGILETARYNLEQAALRTGIDGDILNKISSPKEKNELRLSPKLSSGKVVNIEAYIVRHSDILGPSKGGIRMTPGVTMDEVVGLSMEMTWKTSLIGVPFGGGKSGIRFDPAAVSPDDKEIIIRSFARNARRHFGPELYVPAPDMGTNEADMGHIRDCISHSEGTSITKGCFVTGKPVILGGISGRRAATGKGVVYTIVSACEKFGIKPEKMRVAVQGFGNVGSEAARGLAELGARIVAVSDISGGLFNENGIDIGALTDYSSKKGYIEGFSRAEPVSKEDIFGIPCECLIPAASGSQITVENAEGIKTLIIAEGANAPTTPGADEILNDKGIFVIPDILCNAGGVFVSYLEYVQETQHEQLTETQVETRLRERMQSVFERVYNYSQKHKVSMRQAAMDIAVKRVVEGVNARGLLP
jgi:glutamate dehydrogenase (NAD(P)+)